VLLGIAGGIDDQMRLGDVVAATHVNNYLDRAKAVPDGAGRFDFIPAGDPYRCSEAPLHGARNLKFAHKTLFDTWETDGNADLLRHVPGEHFQALLEKDMIRDTPVFFDGPIASGPIVASSDEFVAWLKSINRTYLAVEMEGGGVLAAASSHVDPASTMILRGISDFGDQRKKELDRIGRGGLRAYAMSNAVRMLWSLLGAGLVPPPQGEPVAFAAPQ